MSGFGSTRGSGFRLAGHLKLGEPSIWTFRLLTNSLPANDKFNPTAAGRGPFSSHSLWRELSLHRIFVWGIDRHRHRRVPLP